MQQSKKWFHFFTFDFYLALYVLVSYIVTFDYFVPMTRFEFGNWGYWAVSTMAAWRLVTFLRQPQPDSQSARVYARLNAWFPFGTYLTLWLFEHLLLRI